MSLLTHVNVCCTEPSDEMQIKKNLLPIVTSVSIMLFALQGHALALKYII